MPEFASAQKRSQDYHQISPVRLDRGARHWAQAAHPLLAQQQSLGNQALQRMLRSNMVQAKLTVNPPDDEYEREADRVAEQVMSMPEPAASKQVQRACSGCEEKVQRQTEEEEEEAVQTKPVAEQITPLVQRQMETKEEEELEETVQTKPKTVQITLIGQKQAGPEEIVEEEPERGNAKNSALNIITHHSHARIAAMHSEGQSLPNDVRAFFEERFGYDFSGVRLHNNEWAETMAKTLNAQAFTIGKDVVFGQGQVDKRLLAHELVHVIQQGNASFPQVQRQLSKGYKRSAGRTSILKKGPEKTVSWIEFNREKKVNSLRALIDRVKDKLFERKFAWDIAYRTLGSAYFTAYDEHKKALEGRAKEKAIEEALAFGIFTAMTVGILGGLGEALETAKIGRYLRATQAGQLEDSVQAAVSEIIDVGQMVVAPTAKTVAKSPFRLQNDLLNANDDQWKELLKYFNWLKATLEKHYSEGPESFDRIDLKKAQKTIEAQWLGKNRMMKEPRIPKESDLARELERKFWIAWIPRLHRKEYTFVSSKTGQLQEWYDMPGYAVEKRLEDVGIARDAGIGEKFGWITTQSQVKMLVDWSEKQKLKPYSFKKQFE
jgi:hypothetical protein